MTLVPSAGAGWPLASTVADACVVCVADFVIKPTIGKKIEANQASLVSPLAGPR